MVDSRVIINVTDRGADILINTLMWYKNNFFLRIELPFADYFVIVAIIDFSSKEILWKLIVTHINEIKKHLDKILPDFFFLTEDEFFLSICMYIDGFLL